MSIRNYYDLKYYEARQEIGELSEDYLLGTDAADIVGSRFEKIRLPLLLKVDSDPVATKNMDRIEVEDDDGDLILHRRTVVRVSYHIKNFDRIEEVLNRTADVENYLPSVKYRKDCIEMEIGTTDDLDGNVAKLEENISSRNRLVENLDCSIEAWLTTYVDNLKKALLQDREERRKIETRPSKKDDNDDGDWDDDRHERTPNDDRSDTLNPDNPAYDDARDNRSDQLNPNNPHYQGE